MKMAMVLVFLITIVFSPLPVAAEEVSCNPGKILPPCTCTGDCSLAEFLDLFVNLYKFGLQVLGPLAVFYMVVGGILLVTAAGHENRITMGKSIVNQAIFGFIIVLMSWIIVDATVFIITGDSHRTVFGKPWYQGFTFTCTSPLGQGCSGDNVGQLQGKLKLLGYPIATDKIFGPQTAVAVENFQNSINRVMVTNGNDSCSVKLWEAVFRRTCGSPCLVSHGEVEAQKLTALGVVDTKTNTLLDLVLSQTAYSDDFKRRCMI